MSDVYLLKNQHDQYLDKSGEWVLEADSKSLYRTEHKDEAINLKVEHSVKKPDLRITLATAQYNDKGKLELQMQNQQTPKQTPVVSEITDAEIALESTQDSVEGSIQGSAEESIQDSAEESIQDSAEENIQDSAEENIQDVSLEHQAETSTLVKTEALAQAQPTASNDEAVESQNNEATEPESANSEAGQDERPTHSSNSIELS